jgi:hypothetical protein
MSKLDKQIEKYQEQLRTMVVMDDYDGGAANQLRIVIDDLRKLQTTTYSRGWREKESEKTS